MAEAPLKVAPAEAPPEVLKVTALATEPDCPVMLAFSDVVETAYVTPAFAPTSPVKDARVGALVKVWVPPQVFEEVVPKARAMVLAVLVSGYVKVSAACFAFHVAALAMRPSAKVPIQYGVKV